jgi:hypothetical protein
MDAQSLERAVRDRTTDGDRERLAAAAVALTAATAVFWLATTVFPYYSANHDEAVYLLQAEMLLEGQLQLRAGDLAEAFRPWFFVEDGGRLYSKYTPVPAAMYAVSMAAFGEPRVTLAAVAGANVALVYVLGATAFDRRVGVVAAAVFAAAPLSLVTSSAFLPYAPATTWNLLFAVCYLRGVRRESQRWAGAAGAAVGIAFFARPYTAVLFAAPFIVHALWQVARAVRERGVRPPAALWPLPNAAARNALTAAGGLAGVGVALAYNAHLTGDPLVFPYEAFAPMDGPGFGRRRILGHSVDYTPELALEANARVLWYFATRWFTAGLAGTACAATGLALATVRWLDATERSLPAGDATERVSALLPDVDPTTGLALAGLFLTVPVGNVPFWGNFNVLATLSDPSDGLIALLGPFYHFDLLAPLSVFTAVAVVAGWRLLAMGLRRRTSVRTARVVLALVLVVSLPAAATANAGLVERPVDRNAAYTEKYDRAYAPFESTEFDDALVFLPTPFGEWQSHPFQYLRNEPGFDGPVVYALERDPDEDFAVVDAYPNRTYYRYAYNGEWTPGPDEHVVPKLERIGVRERGAFAGETGVGVPPGVESARVELRTDEGSTQYAIADPGDSVAVSWSLDAESAHLDAADGNDSTVAINGSEEVELVVTMVTGDGSTLTYRQIATVRPRGDDVQVLWPPERRVCTLVPRCGTEGTFLPDHPEEHVGGVSFETELSAVNGSERT